ncbi:hypothetical protein KIPB_011542 [Kipferlia bialata]|uniref:Uncharacterized protein n=1 Tax=Kipferlia bialata TaxID=797122 RepID=A0A9K3D520_9EUKA|nr:hypothetical protein KIPB_011542 [Kipferlia bialata]|eukprot:g11542.t1
MYQLLDSFVERPPLVSLPLSLTRPPINPVRHTPSPSPSGQGMAIPLPPLQDDLYRGHVCQYLPDIGAREPSEVPDGPQPPVSEHPVINRNLELLWCTDSISVSTGTDGSEGESGEGSVSMWKRGLRGVSQFENGECDNYILWPRRIPSPNGDVSMGEREDTGMSEHSVMAQFAQAVLKDMEESPTTYVPGVQMQHAQTGSSVGYPYPGAIRRVPWSMGGYLIPVVGSDAMIARFVLALCGVLDRDTDNEGGEEVTDTRMGSRCLQIMYALSMQLNMSLFASERAVRHGLDQYRAGRELE